MCMDPPNPRAQPSFFPCRHSKHASVDKVLMLFDD